MKKIKKKTGKDSKMVTFITRKVSNYSQNKFQKLVFVFSKFMVLPTRTTHTKELKKTSIKIPSNHRIEFFFWKNKIKARFIRQIFSSLVDVN